MARYTAPEFSPSPPSATSCKQRCPACSSRSSHSPQGAQSHRIPAPPLPAREPGTAGPARQDQRWVYKLFRAGLFGPDDVPDIGLDNDAADFLNRGNIASWGNDQFWLFPNISVQIWARGYYITYTYWPETVDSHIYEIDLYFVPPANAADRLAQELVVDSTIEFAMQDVNTIEATHSALKTRAQNTFHLSDQELLIRQFHTVIRDTVGAYQSANSTRET